MNAGANQAHGDVLVFLHADTVLPDDADQLIRHTLSNEKCLWGCFDVKLSGSHLFLRIVETFMNLRSRMTGIVTGDKALGRPTHIGNPVITSSRLWEQNGILRTVTKMWGLRFAYFLGVSPNKLVKLYYSDHA